MTLRPNESNDYLRREEGKLGLFDQYFGAHNVSGLVSYLDDLPPISQEQNKSAAAQDIYVPLLAKVDHLMHDMVACMESTVRRVVDRMSLLGADRNTQIEAASTSLKAIIVCIEQLNAEGTPLVKHILSGYAYPEDRQAVAGLALGHLRTGLMGALAAIFNRVQVPQDLMGLTLQKCQQFLPKFMEESSYVAMQVHLAQNVAAMRHVQLNPESLNLMKVKELKEWNEKLWKFIKQARSSAVPYAVVQENSVVEGKAHWLFDEHVLGAEEDVVKTDFASVALVTGDMDEKEIVQKHEDYIASFRREEVDGHEYLFADHSMWGDKALIMHMNTSGDLERGVLFTDALRLSLGDKNYEVLRASALLHLAQLTCREQDLALFFQEKGVSWEPHVPNRRPNQKKKKKPTKFSSVSDLARKYFPNLDGQGKVTHVDKKEDIADDEEKVFRMYNQSYYMPLLKLGYKPSQRAIGLAKDAGQTLGGALVSPEGTRMNEFAIGVHAKEANLTEEEYKEHMQRQGWVWRLRTFAKISPERVRTAVVAQERQDLMGLGVLRSE